MTEMVETEDMNGGVIEINNEVFEIDQNQNLLELELNSDLIIYMKITLRHQAQKPGRLMEIMQMRFPHQKTF